MDRTPNIVFLPCCTCWVLQLDASFTTGAGVGFQGSVSLLSNGQDYKSQQHADPAVHWAETVSNPETQTTFEGPLVTGPCSMLAELIVSKLGEFEEQWTSAGNYQNTPEVQVRARYCTDCATEVTGANKLLRPSALILSYSSGLLCLPVSYTHLTLPTKVNV